MKSLVKISFVTMSLLVCFLSTAQTLEDAEKKYPIRTISSLTSKTRTTENNNFSFSFCDEDADGVETINLADILSTVQAGVAGDLSTVDPKIFIGTSTGEFLEVNDILGTPSVDLVCNAPVVSLDVAVNSNGELFTANSDSIDQINPTDCALTAVYAGGGNSLSFDTQNNLYFNDFTQSSSGVYRLESGLAGSPALWHDFVQGQPGGDFVILGNFMYIAWIDISGNYVLFKVTIDSNINYVSHEVLGQIKPNTYGLASELGVLYGVTDSEIYKINLDSTTLTFDTLLLNDFTYGAWFGAAGFNEAVDLQSSAHLTQTDADNNTGALNQSWTNQTSGNQTIYIRTEDVANGNYIVTPVDIIYDAIPNIAAAPTSLEACDNDDNGSELFDFTIQTSTILGSQDPAVFEVVYSTQSDFSSTITDPTSYQGLVATQTIYYRIQNANNNQCNTSGSFDITVLDASICEVNLPPEISVSARNPYCPEDIILIAENFSITDPDDVSIELFTVQISSGYVNGSDFLVLTGTHPTINSVWNATLGTLTLSSSITSEILYSDLIPAVRQIAYQSTNAGVIGERFFSFNIGDANYLPSTGHFYEYVPENLIDWESAKVAAENRTYFGLQGYLATILTADEAQLSGEQAAGTGWIGGSDAAVEGVWRWVTGPEAGTIFWTGGVGGTTPNFAFWNTNEPNNLGNEDYAHVTDPSIGIPGSWNDLPLNGGTGLYEPRGYIVEYGGMPGDPILSISGSTSIFIPTITSHTGATFCSGESVTLEAESSEGEVYWYDAPTGGNLLTIGTTYTTSSLINTTTYYVAAGPQDCTNTQRIPVVATANSLPQVNDPVALSICEMDQDGLAIFDLTLANSLISADSVNQTFQYYPTETDAQNDTNEIVDSSNYQSLVETADAVWVRTINASSCFVVSRLNLQVTSTHIPSSLSLFYEECDDFIDVVNDDTDGVSNFDFSDASAQILDAFLASQAPNISIQYYPTEVDAINRINEIIDISNFRNTIPTSQQIYTRVTNTLNNICVYIGTHITLNVLPSPSLAQLDEFNVCDDDSDGDDTNGFVQNINLGDVTPLLLNGQDPSLFTITYHESRADATAGSNALSSPYSNTTANTQTIYVRVVENSTGCFNDRNSFTLNIRPLPVITSTVELKQCDNDTDGFSNFNLFEAATDISSNYINETFVFYPTEDDAVNDTNSFTVAEATVYENQTVTIDTVWARAISNFGCYRISQVNLIVSTTGLPATFQQRSFTVCDDFLDTNGNDNANNDDTDGISSFDFSSVTQDIVDIFPPSQQLTVTYYRDEADALAENNPITDPANYRNIGFPNTQQIYIRVDSDLDNDCLGFGPFISLTVDPVPLANPVDDLELCDNADDGDFSNGIVQTFDLDSQTATILGSQDPADYTVSYHLSPTDALAGSNAITNTDMYENSTPNRQTIYVRVTNNNAGCFTNHTSFDLIVNELPVANFVPDLEICDDDSDGSARNGFSQSFDLELQTAGILGTQDPTQFNVTYHASLNDALDGVLALGSPFSNTQPNRQTIYVRVSNGNTGCANGISNFDVIVNPEPIAANVSNLSYCDDDLDLDDTNGFVQNIDLDSQILGILDFDNTGQDQDDYTVTFHESSAEAQSGDNPLSSPYSNRVPNQQTIYVRVQNNNTGCVNDDFVFDVIVDPLPVFEVTSPQIVCLNGPELNLFVENPAAIYDYVWTDPSGNTLTGAEININSGGNYSVTATTTDGTGCSRTRSIQVDESIIATITEDDITIVDDSDNNSITVDPTNLGIGDYEYSLLDEDGIIIRSYQDSPIFDNLQGGIYTILVQDKNGCGVASLEVSVIQFPKFFTPNNDGFNDTWEIKGANSFYFPTSEINIFNRFGKIVSTFDVDSDGWDGNMNGRILPSDDYWYSIKLVDRNGVVRSRKGNFSLLRK